MTLREYKKKRDFKKTPEPKGLAKKAGKELLFTIQKHAASHLHYDLRLEYKGVLLSWAVPKEPSMDPSVKRLAIHVEDHPFDYAKFEGVIPKGNYGAGTVSLWDQGTYSVPDTETIAEAEKIMKAGLAKGHIGIVFHGRKLKGTFDLVQLKNQDDDKQWLFFKRKEKETSDKQQEPKRKPAPVKREVKKKQLR
jgi:bifunctional non-homologous end joining protein LigD